MHEEGIKFKRGNKIKIKIVRRILSPTTKTEIEIFEFDENKTSTLIAIESLSWYEVLISMSETVNKVKKKKHAYHEYYRYSRSQTNEEKDSYNRLEYKNNQSDAYIHVDGLPGEET